MSKLSLLDIIGPIMLGPSSSHTAGAVRIGNLAREIVAEEIEEVKFHLHGSFKETYQGHGTDKALLGGLLGLSTADPKIKNAFELAEEKGIEFDYLPVELDGVHPNTAKLEIKDRTDKTTTIVASSVGGGSVVIKQIDGINVDLNGEYHTLITLHQDKPGVMAKISRVLEEDELNIAFMKVLREYKGALATAVIELDHNLTTKKLRAIKEIAEIKEARIIKPVK
ncbi:L-serine ammonia-lyase, iron-sulfur-dependent subunit beta [Natroniella sulfidigena]|uniref:L-serine ammonia-lyase, iron-sulfur-dependent subunit beta n=1 Tax=Natroniella sulfidigena TaxID=723921 RepID=UPI00200A1800|nr:L-serine ammonia-lyase, iron-sulfur-dependent subunit beta [Natroniella sulfidigena]MCK8817546.1 L-serine ammonia-lyase, iron-sulfur-dependent subunit beta [Natroniella sulfidigena]